MIIKGVGKRLEFYKLDKKLTYNQLEHYLNLSKASIQNIIDTDNVVKTETFFKIFRLLNLDIEAFLNTEVMTQINNVLGPNHGTIQNIATVESRQELELIIEHQKKEISRLEDALRRADEMIELLKKSK